MEKIAYISEIFSSIQGEGTFIGEKQLFIRFCGCNLNCDFCDTDFEKNEFIKIFDVNENITKIPNPVSSTELEKNIEKLLISPHHSISLTGGEPLLYSDFLSEFLKNFKSKYPQQIYLETNGTLYKNLEQIVDLIDIVAMDIKLKSVTGEKNQFYENEEFIKTSIKANKNIFIKIILNKNYDKDELQQAINIIKKYDLTLIIQPANYKNKSKEFNKKELIQMINEVIALYPKTRLIPQVHIYLNLL